MDIKEYISIKKNIIDKALDGYLPSINIKPKELHKAMRYSVFSGGKRIRPVLAAASFEACGGSDRSIIPLACAIELIHTYTLIHDDLPSMDNDDFRRGRQSCHKKFGEPLALLAGDALLTMSFEVLSETKNTDVIKNISRSIGTSGTIGGQAVDILKKDSSSIKKCDLDYITRHKTGLLFETAIVSPGILMGVDKPKIKALTEFSKCIGFSFQLIDDLMDDDGYVRIYGKGLIKKKAKSLTDKASRSLSIFGKNGRVLMELGEFILKRSK
ncbi:MAG: polyprenyl synthetase family protein [Candidatus Omnitrophota bacterium]